VGEVHVQANMFCCENRSPLYVAVVTYRVTRSVKSVANLRTLRAFSVAREDGLEPGRLVTCLFLGGTRFASSPSQTACGLPRFR
jgi:hypothetical protein